MVDMRRIKLFESFNELTEEEIRGALVDLSDVGYDVFIKKKSKGYRINISVEGEYFDIVNVSEPILTLMDYFSEKFGNRFVYSIIYMDENIDEVEIEDLEQFVKDNPMEDTDEVIIKLKVK
jgi:hypothetical protein